MRRTFEVTSLCGSRYIVDQIDAYAAEAEIAERHRRPSAWERADNEKIRIFESKAITPPRKERP